MGVSAENKALANYLRVLLGGTPRVNQYWDDAKTNSVDILSVGDAPTPKVTTFATLRLSDCPTHLRSNGVPLGVEFLMAAGTAYAEAPSILATCAFEVINSGKEYKPGSIFPRVVELYRPRSAMKHILLVTPFLWNLETQSFPSKVVAWVLAVPISDTESAFANDRGSDALESVFEARQIDIFDLDRSSVI